MTDRLTRAVRTFFQAFLGTLIGTGVLSAMAESGEVADASVIQKALISAGVAGLIAVVSYVQNLLEDTTSIKTIK